MNKKDFKNRCKNLKKKCTNIKSSGENCDHHISLKNLQDISRKMETILKQSKEISNDWKDYKRLKVGKHGYIAMTLNFPDISDELSKVKKLIKAFNTSRRNLWKFKDIIKNFRIEKIETTKLQ